MSVNLDEKAKSRVFALIPASDGAGFYAATVPGTDGWTLPLFETSAPGATDSVVELIEQEARAALGLNLHFLGCHIASRPERGQAFVAVAVFENLSPYSSLRLDLRVLPVIDAARLVPPDHAALVRTTLAEWSSGQFPPERVAWSRPGWLAEVAGWIEASLAAAGLAPDGPLLVHKLWTLSCLIRQPTNRGDTFFKAVPELFAVEPALTRYLADNFPGQVPDVIATDPRHWLLMRAFTGRPLRDEPDADLWIGALRGYAEIQKAMSKHSAELLALGCPARPLSGLRRQIRIVLDDVDALQIGHDSGVSEADHRALLDLLPAFDQAADEMTAIGLPDTLEHGDLHADNIAVRPEGRIVYYDWTDGCLTQPLLGLTPFLEVAKPELHAALCDAYLNPWRDHATDAQLQRALRLARVLSPLHIAVSYYNIRRATEPRQHWELAGALAYCLREALAHARQLEL